MMKSPDVNDGAVQCTVCGTPAFMLFMHGAPCPEHAFVVEPSAAVIADDVVFTLAIGRE